MSIAIGQTGLKHQELCVLKGLFSLHPAIAGKFVLVETGFTDVMLINADEEQALNQFRTLKLENPGLEGIFLCSNRNSAFTARNCFYRPLNVGRFVNLLLDVCIRNSVCSGQSRQAALQGRPQQRQMRVLVVDDSLPLRRFMEHVLPKLYPDVSMLLEFAESGQDALRLVEQQHHHRDSYQNPYQNYDLLFLDVVMPGIDGYQVCKKIKSRSDQSRVVMLTSRKSPFDRIRGKLSGCDSYLTKPPQESELRAAILACMDFVSSAPPDLGPLASPVAC